MNTDCKKVYELKLFDGDGKVARPGDRIHVVRVFNVPLQKMEDIGKFTIEITKQIFFGRELGLPQYMWHVLDSRQTDHDGMLLDIEFRCMPMYLPWVLPERLDRYTT